MQEKSQATPESAIEAAREKLKGLALELADNESRLDLVNSQARSLNENRASMIMEYQKTLHGIIAMSEVHNYYVEESKKAEVAPQHPVVEATTPDPKAFTPTYDYAQEGLETGKKPVQKVNK